MAAALFPLAGCERAPEARLEPEIPVVQDVDPEAKRVLVVINKASQDSVAVGGYYVSKRKVPRSNVAMVDVSTADNILPAQYKSGIEAPIQEAIKKSGNTIDFIVLTKGVPLRLQDGGGPSVDGQLTAMNLKLTYIGKLDPKTGEEQIRKSLNPYYQAKERFSSKKFGGMYLVTRLDAYTLTEAKRLVDLSLAAKPDKGPFFFDASPGHTGGGYGETQKTLIAAQAVLKSRGFDTTLDETGPFVAPPDPLMGYASWGSNDGSFNLDTYRKLRFKPGALAETFVSTSGRTFTPTTGGQSLIADLITQGVTGVKGYVSEPFTFALAQPDILFDRYVSGFNLAESFYAASLVTYWKDIVIGDPLCRPYAK